ncbi:MAG: ribosomal protein [Daejeonella sp.]|nr:ribosomal protein [Daejeonella sp.]
MNDYQIDPASLNSESDVEQKVIWPLLTKPDPIGLGYHQTEIQTKLNLKKLEIDKGAKSHLYYPDYLITIDGIPSIIIEAKKPEEDLNEAYRQASLYAAEINRYFESNVNPCSLIIACDGIRLAAGYWDQAEKKYEIETENWIATDKKFNEFISVFAKSKLSKSVEILKKTIRRNIQFKKPLYLLGGNSIQNKQTTNSFGETISIEYQHLFNPITEDEKVNVVKNAYVKVYKHESHLNPIDKLLRKKLHPSLNNTTEIGDNINPKEITNRLKSASRYNNQVLLLVGSVGSGKSTFMTYLREVALDETLKNSLFWATLNLNNAPVNSTEIYHWIKHNLIEQIREKFHGVDFDSYEIISKVYSQEILKFDKLAGVLLNKESDRYKSQLYDKIQEFQKDSTLTLNCYINEFITNSGKELIIILDNCDKRNLQEQLLMFEVANWIKDTIKSIVFLPLRDTTYDHYRNEKPLDTVIKDLTFRITPASLEKVIYSRINFASRLSQNNNDRYYFLSDSIKVRYPAEDELYYLKSILFSLFQNTFFKKLLIGLAGSDIRKGIEIFTDFCKSGHISDSDIFKMKQLRGQHKLPNHIISKVFLRGNKFYYNDESSMIKNVFANDPSDTLPNPFVRICILKWLHSNYRIKGPSGALGYHSCLALTNYLIGLGQDKKRIETEILFLIRQKLINSESQDSSHFKYEELVSISTAGIIHLEIVGNLDYLSAISEDTWFEQVQPATLIAKNMAGEGRLSHLSIQNVLVHSETLVSYLSYYYEKYFKVYHNFMEDSFSIDPLEIDKLNALLSNSKNSLKSNLFKELEAGGVCDCKIVNIKFYGIIVEIADSKQIGFVSSNQLDEDFESKFHLEEVLRLKIIKYNQVHKKYDMAIVK